MKIKEILFYHADKGIIIPMFEQEKNKEDQHYRTISIDMLGEDDNGKAILLRYECDILYFFHLQNDLINKIPLGEGLESNQ